MKVGRDERLGCFSGSSFGSDCVTVHLNCRLDGKMLIIVRRNVSGCVCREFPETKN